MTASAAAQLPGDQADAVILDQDFSAIRGGALPPGWRSSADGWRAAEGVLEGAPLGKETSLSFGENDWRDVALEVEFEFGSEGSPTRWVALVLREGGAGQSGIQLTMRRDARLENGLELARRGAGANGGWRIYQTASAPPEFATKGEHRLRIEASGGNVRGFLDGAMLLELPRSDASGAAGRAGLCVNGTSVRVRRVRVERLSPGEPRGRPEGLAAARVIAHRGFSSVAPECTIAAYREALRSGASMAECDVHLSADRVPMVIHDSNLERTAGFKRAVADLPAVELAKVDVGSWKDQRFAGEGVPTLEQVVSLLRSRMPLAVEIKTKAMEKEVLAVCASLKIPPDGIDFFAFERDTLVNLRALGSSYPATWLIDAPPSDPTLLAAVLDLATETRVHAIGVSLTRTPPGLFAAAHERGLEVYVYTADDPEDIRYLDRVGADAIITNCPDVAIATLSLGK